MQIEPDYSIKIEFQEQEILVDATYDRVDIFRPLGFAMLKIVTSNGFLRMGTDIPDAEAVAEGAGITPQERTTIRQSEYDFYLSYMEKTLDDDWLEE